MFRRRMVGVHRAVVTTTCLVAMFTATAALGESVPNPAPQFREGEVLVRYQKDVSPAAALKALSAHSLVQIREYPHLSQIKGQRYTLVKGEGRKTEDLVRELRQRPEVDIVVPNYLRKTSMTPNDPYFGDLWGMRAISAPVAWDMTSGSPDVVVADIDTGIETTHVDLLENLWVNVMEIAGNGIDDDGNGYVDDVYGFNAIMHDGNVADDNGHGTHTAGTVAATGNNGIGVVGVSWQTKVMALKFLNSGGWGYDGDAIECIEYVLSMKSRGVNVVAINASWGGGGYDPLLEDAIAATGDVGIIFVAAAGNSSSNNDISPFYPASYPLPNLISVAATNGSDYLAWFSNFGPASVHLAAPGEGILSTMYGWYSYLDGTSMATPHVTGAVALAATRFPDDTMAKRRDRVLLGVDYLPQLEGVVQGAGRLNAAQVLDPVARPVIKKVDDFLYAPRIGFTITGANFGSASGTITCTDQYGSTFTLTTAAWSDTAIRVVMPDTVLPYSMTLTTADGLSVSRSISLLFTEETQIPVLTGNGAAGVSVGGYEYLFSGYDRNWWYSSAAERYDPVNKTWIELAPVWQPRFGAAAAELDGKIYLAGGSEYGWPSSRVDMYDPATNSYQQRNSLPSSLSNGAMANLNGVLYFSGGSGDYYMSRNFYRYDPAADAWTALPPMSTERHSHRMVPLNGKLYVLGGYGPSWYEPSCEVYDPAVNAWSPIAGLPLWGLPGSAATDGDFIYLMGGDTTQVFRYSPAADSWTTIPFTLPSAGGGPGAFLNGSLYVFGGNYSTGKVMALKTDLVPPRGSLTINGGAPATSSPTVELAISARDDYGVEAMRMSEDTINWSDWQPLQTTGQYTFTGEGSKNLYVEVRDVNGNVATFTAKILYDITAPTGAIAISEGDTVAKTGAVVIGVTASDQASSVVSMQFSNDAITWSTWEPYAPTRVWKLIPGDGPHVVYARFTDSAGNVSAPCSDTIEVDSTLPSGSVVINGGAGFTNTQTVALTVSASAASGRVTQMQFSTDAAAWTPWERYATIRSFTFAATGDGERRIYVRFRDSNMKVSPFCRDTIVVESVPPIGSVVINDDATFTTASTVTLALTATDNLSGVTHMQISSDNATWTTWEPFSTTRAGAALVRGDGTKSVFVRFRDAAGNISTVASDAIVADLTAPAGSILINNGAQQSNYPYVRLTIAASDRTSGVSAMQLSTDNVTWQEWEPFSAVRDPFTLSGTAGMNYVYVRFKDNAGNLSKVFSDSIRFVRLTGAATSPLVSAVSVP